MSGYSIYSDLDHKFYYKKDVPQTLRSFLEYNFSSGPVTGGDFISFNTKFKNVIKKLLPEGYTIYSWNRGHYYISGVIETPDKKYIYLSIDDVRWSDNWLKYILIRTMNNPKDWTGGMNHFTSLFSLGENIKKLYR